MTPSTDRLDRTLAEIDAGDALLNAFVHLDPQGARAQWATRPTGPLAGELVAVKDNIAVRGAPWACGSSARRDRHRDQPDAVVVQRLRAAGAVVIGTTNLDEFAMGASTESSAWGPTRNPRNPARTAGGSSGGSAAAVAAYDLLGVGTDTGGSIREPAAFCGIVGVAPSPGTVPMDGVVPFAATLDRVGPMAPDVARTAALHDVLAGVTGGDCTRAARAGREQADLTGWRVGRLTAMSGDRNASGVLEHFDRALALLDQLGADIVEIALPHFGNLLDTYLAVSSVEALEILTRHAPEELGREARSRAELGRSLERTVGHTEALRMRERIAAEAREVLTRCHLMVSPTVPLVAPLLGHPGLDDPLARPRTDWWTVEANLAGLTAMSLPIGETDGLPVGLQLMSAGGEDSRLYQCGAALESVLN